jgi:hypothetical protein
MVTVGDHLRFVAALRAGVLLTAELTTLFFTPQVRHDQDVEYGFGPQFSGGTGGRRAVGAGGIIRHYGEHGVDAAVLSNTRDDAWPVVCELDRLARTG